MNNYEILQHYSKGDLRRLAKGKISEIVGLDADKILRDLSRVLGNYESVKRNIEFRTPPTDTVLEVLLETPEHQVRADDLRQAVRKRIHDYTESAKALDFKNPRKNYRLYAKMLAAAWDFDDDFNESEANLLRVLRDELGITRREHQLVLAHPDVARLKYSSADYDDSIEFLTSEGLLLVYRDNDDTHFVLSDETSDSLLQLWGFVMRLTQRKRLFTQLAKPQLVTALKHASLPSSGAHGELVARLLENEIPASPVLDGLTTSELVGLLAKLGLPRSGSREERTLRLIDHFRSDADISVTAVEAPKETEPEPESLSDENLADLYDELGVGLLAETLQALGMQKSGPKAEKIQRLIQSPYNSQTVLQVLSLNDLRDLAANLGLRKVGNKSQLIESVLDYYTGQTLKPSELTPKDLLDFYDELSRQDRRAYPAFASPTTLSSTRMGLDFERATRYIFKNLLRLDTKVQKAGQEEPDGVLVDDDGTFYCYECKTVLSPPYSLPIQHRLQLRNYLTAIARSRRADQFGGYIIVAHSFTDALEKGIAAIDSPLEAPIAAIEARDLLALARKWQQDHPTDTYPVGAALKSGRVAMKDLQRAGVI